MTKPCKQGFCRKPANRALGKPQLSPFSRRHGTCLHNVPCALSHANRQLRKMGFKPLGCMDKIVLLHVPMLCPLEATKSSRRYLKYSMGADVMISPARDKRFYGTSQKSARIVQAFFWGRRRHAWYREFPQAKASQIATISSGFL